MSLLKITPSLFIGLATLLVPSTAFAQEYGCGLYGAGNYNEGDCAGDLANTGENVWPLRILGIILLLLALAVAYYTYRKYHKNNKELKHQDKAK